MKPKPTSSMQAATSPGSSSMLAPRASSTSAEPLGLLAERLPCFATLQPAPAATRAAVVETLKVGRPPPVPAVSTTSPPTSAFAARSRMVRARRAISATVSPWVRNPIRNPAVSGSEALPAMTSWRTREASSADRSSPAASRSIASVRIGLGIEEVPQELLAMVGEHRLGVELHTLGRQLPVPQAHDGLAGARRDLELVGQGRVDDQRVVAAGHERGIEPGEDRPSVVLDLRRLAVHGLAAHDLSTEGHGQCLMAEADAENRRALGGEARDCRARDPGLGRGARPGRHDHALVAAPAQVVRPRLAGATHPRL